MAAENYKSRTLFIRNLSFNTTNEKLNELFEDVGPIKQCFVVKDKGSSNCKGYGYVKFALIDDAAKAKDTIKSLDGRKLFVNYADFKKKKPRRTGKKQHKDSDEESDDEEKEEKKDEKKNDKESINKSESLRKQDTKYLKAKIVVLTGLDEELSSEQVESLVSASNVKKVSRIVYPVEDRNAPTAFLKFKCIRDANRAIKKLHDKTIKGYKLSAVQLSKEFVEAPQKLLKKCRLIVRNLSFQIQVKELTTHFEKFGEITEVKLPKKPDGKLMGFGFIQFVLFKSAEAAISSMNGVKIRGRPIAVDWALAKNQYEKMKDESSEDEGSYSTESEDEDKSEGEEEEGDSDAEESDEEESDEEDESGSSNESTSSDEGFRDGSPGETTPANKKVIRKEGKSDVDEGKTLFIRNVPFNSEEEELKDVLVDFGTIEYCKLVMDPLTQHSKGTAFVKFSTVEEADRCLAKAEDTSKDGGIVLNERPLKVSKALRRKEAVELKEKEKKKDTTDKRNLFLVREGLIRQGTAAAEGIPKSDLVKRTKIESEMRQKLKNANIFVSSTRLCVQNLPLEVDDKTLRQKLVEAAEDKTVKVTECRIMRDMKRVNAKGVGKSRGFAFVGFTDHQHALNVLRAANNTIFNGKRLIVHFSLEDQRKVFAQQKKLEKVKARNAANAMKSDGKQEGKEGKPEPKNRRRGKGKLKRTTEQDEVARGMYSGPKGLPSHSGPKIRHKARPGQGQGQTKKRVNNQKGQSQGKAQGQGKGHGQGQGQGQRRNEVKEHTEGQGQKRQREDNSEQGSPKKKKKKSKKRGKGPQTDNFDKMVQSYKNKLTAGADGHRKWFD